MTDAARTDRIEPFPTATSDAIREGQTDPDWLVRGRPRDAAEQDHLSFVTRPSAVVRLRLNVAKTGNGTTRQIACEVTR